MKNQQRNKAMKNRRALSSQLRQQYSAEICRKLLDLPELMKAGTVLSYMADWDEVELNCVNKALEERGCAVAYPVCMGQGRMEAYIPVDEDAVEVGVYGIKSPVIEKSKLVDPAEIELVLVPCVAFDKHKNRLGHGAGYYDRYLPCCGEVVCIAPAFDAQCLKTLATGEHDRKMDIIVTENAVMR